MHAGPYIRSRIEGERQTASEFRQEASKLEADAKLLREAAVECDRRARRWEAQTDYRAAIDSINRATDRELAEAPKQASGRDILARAVREVMLRGGPGRDYPCNNPDITECALSSCQHAGQCMVNLPEYRTVVDILNSVPDRERAAADRTVRRVGISDDPRGRR